MMIFLINDLIDEERAYEFLVNHLWPDGLRCPEGHPLAPGQGAHDYSHAPKLKYRCRTCGRVFDAFTGTVLSGRHYSCAQIVLILRGFARGTPTSHLAKELGIDRGNLLEWRHELQALLEERFSPLNASRRGGRGGRNVPKRRREGHFPPGPGGPAAEAGEQGPRPRELGNGSPAGLRSGRSGEWKGLAFCGTNE